MAAPRLESNRARIPSRPLITKFVREEAVVPSTPLSREENAWRRIDERRWKERRVITEEYEIPALSRSNVGGT